MKILITRLIKYPNGYNYIEGFINGGLVTFEDKNLEIITELNLMVGNTYRIKQVGRTVIFGEQR